ncbi:NADH:flavin oxidoreductase/NADH oxidase [Leptospirillum ferriphilum]|jgi:2,4-dienoyl-CoA reductase-like NADH-dependent reductase (Old Yellow Enzyme family)|uniref:Oxidoreductase n=1 Tax=Leptospirillum ferriphilum TaxID=178606 RepID=A0A1V3SY04_9BACT|nr:NADH:flavin oxidoreductase/NADH oxidase [Leptospirillum ferriphilum]OOH74408.1 oxidoreductase [Leptospirillum ferriphilum]
MSRLFEPMTIQSVTLRNRICVSPMCQYSTPDGVAGDWHMVHLGSRAVGGAGVVMVEASAVSPEGRITPDDLGLWNDRQAEALRPIAAFIRRFGAVAGIQIAHAGRKASTAAPFKGGHPLSPSEGGWETLGPSAVPFGHYPSPRAMEKTDLDKVQNDFRASAQRALSAGFNLLELHLAHGYLLHSFLSPLSNRRTDAYGGPLENRMRFPLEVVRTVREVWPASLPLWVRISSTDWVPGGWDPQMSVELCRHLKAEGVDVIDASSGGLSPDAVIPLGPGYQTGIAALIRREADIPVVAVGMITDPVQAEHVLVTGQADLVSLAREMLRDPYWPLHAAHRLGQAVDWPAQYERAKPR